MDNMELTLTIEEEPQATLNLGVAEGATDEASARTAEAYAKGTRNGVPVEEGDPAYHNNAKYYRDSAAAIAAGDVIDDDAGAGDYNLTWSADKLTSQKADIDALESSKADAIEVTDSTPTSVMSFSDGGNGYPLSATFGIAPVQDLHGYDNPWPGGGSKNLNEFTENKTSSHRNIDFSAYIGSHFTASGTANGNNATLDYTSIHPYTFVANTKYIFSFEGTGTNLISYVFLYDSNQDSAGTVSISGGVGEFVPEANTSVAKIRIRLSTSDGTVVSVNCNWQVEIGNAATSWVPYENLCPITGWTGCKPSRTGKNLFSTEIEQGLIDSTDGQKGSSSASNHSKRIRTKDYIFLKAGTYTISCAETLQAMVLLYGLDKTYITPYGGTPGNVSFTNLPMTITLDADYYMMFACKYSNNGAITPSNMTNVQIEMNSSATAYNAPSCVTLPISFPAGAGTVYGGSLTVNKDGTGKLVVDKKGILGSALTWTKHDSYNCFTATPDDKKPGTGYESGTYELTGELLSSRYAVRGETLSAIGNGTMRGHTTNKAIYIRDDNYANATEFNADASNFQIVYALDTVVEYDLTATEVGQILSLLGTNNLFCDTGNVLSVSYTADTKLYIEKLTQPTEDDMTANANIASGKFFMVGNSLFMSTQAIAQGATIVPGTNCTAFSLAEALNTINT